MISLQDNQMWAVQMLLIQTWLPAASVPQLKLSVRTSLGVFNCVGAAGSLTWHKSHKREQKCRHVTMVNRDIYSFSPSVKQCEYSIFQTVYQFKYVFKICLNFPSGINKVYSFLFFSIFLTHCTACLWVTCWHRRHLLEGYRFYTYQPQLPPPKSRKAVVKSGCFPVAIRTYCSRYCSLN